MIFVAQKSDSDSKVGLKEIAEGTDTPVPFMAKIMQELSKKKLVHSSKGPNGGFYMNKKNLKTSIADIVLATDGDGIYSKCVLGLKNCNEKTPCPVHHEYKDIKKKFIAMLEKNTITDFNEKLMTKKFFLKNEEN